jgi:hypothetical protein
MKLNSFWEERIMAFAQMLNLADIDSIEMSAYAKRYLKHLLIHKNYYCRIYAHVLGVGLQNAGLNKEEICLVDYGAGNGLLGIFAKFCGFKNVYINDLSPDFIDASKVLAKALSTGIDGFIVGDINDVGEYFSSVKPQMIVGSDVIEHIYKLDFFFERLRQVSPTIITVFSTASNPKNYFKVRQLKKLQTRDELFGGTIADNPLYGDADTPPFLKTRQNIIRNYALNLPEEKIHELATLSRGLQKKDIEAAVAKFIINGEMPLMILDDTNTCDPITGSWTERILSIEAYNTLYSTAGFNLKIYNGFYNGNNNSIKGLILRGVNLLVILAGIRLAPFITLVGYPKGNKDGTPGSISF